ncbi:Altronate dehydratase [Pelotomaculum sp. FP]|uniref:UxaA family hydrolase n=1 Tax=Pelotomaculum sp. FP TaxID=261474 RepID=UPI0011037673|nr:UxaA family hydrolase [Pelotomaculum sp. FP]TEB16683.1 Altronate dehydratase [Pelotomaculum sp. FP]
MIKAIVMNEKDNVATALCDISEGSRPVIVGFKSKQGIVVKSNIPFGHKFALCKIPENVSIIKYGEVIGVSNSFIEAGDYVHVHNVESLRGRGDHN